jgi:hypothetical protein
MIFHTCLHCMLIALTSMLFIMSGMQHVLLCDPSRDLMLRIGLNWLTQHISFFFFSLCSSSRNSLLPSSPIIQQLSVHFVLVSWYTDAMYFCITHYHYPFMSSLVLSLG